MDFLGLVAGSAGIGLVFAVIFRILLMIADATGYSWYQASAQEYVATILNKHGYSKETSWESVKRFGRGVRRRAWKNVNEAVEALDDDFQEKVQHFLGLVDGNPSSRAEKQCAEAIEQLVMLTGYDPNYEPSHIVDYELVMLKEALGHFEDADEITRDEVLNLIDSKNFTGKFQWILNYFQKEYFASLFKEFLDYAGRGTTAGVFVGFSIALSLKDPFGVVATSIPIVGAILGASLYSFKLGLVGNSVKLLVGESPDSTTWVVLKEIFILCILYILGFGAGLLWLFMTTR